MAQHFFISNFTNGETVTHSLVILKCHFNAKNCSNVREKKITIEHFERKEILNITSHFKLILNLKEGKNSISLKFCCGILDFHLTYSPRHTDYTVCPLYIICKDHDGRFQAPENQDNSKNNACKRIDVVTKMLQCVTAEKLFEKTLTRKTFEIGNQCQIFHSNLLCSDMSAMNEKELWEAVARDIMKSKIGNHKTKYLGFISCTKYNGDKFNDSMKNHNDLINITDSYIALGGGGLALFGSASFFTWPENFQEIIQKFEDETQVDKRQFLDDSCYRGTYGACFSTSFGSVLHELCHTFDLGHSETGIMSRGFDNVYKVFTQHFDNGSITSKFNETIEFQESFEPKLLSERLKNEPKQSQITGVMRKGKDADDTFWSKSCATILSYHRWFNNFPITSNFVLKFDSNSRAFSSTAGLRVVELRRFHDEYILKDWVFEGIILKYSFQLPVVLEDVKNCLVFAEDNVGNILKFQFPSA